MEVNEQIVKNFNYLLKTYDRITKTMVQTSNCYCALVPGEDVTLKKEYASLEQAKGMVTRQIEKELQNFDIWNMWMKKIPGVGPYVAGNLIIRYYYKFIPICKECGADLLEDFSCSGCGKVASGMGVLHHRIIEREFPTISKWQKFMGRGIDKESGKLPKRAKGKQSNWSQVGRVITWHLWQQFNRQGVGHFYKAYLLERRHYRETTHPAASKGHNLNMAGNETSRLFLSHFWHVAREIAGLSTEAPWIIAHGGHEHIIYPYYWEGVPTTPVIELPPAGEESFAREKKKRKVSAVKIAA
jgi:hypothetical protein